MDKRPPPDDAPSSADLLSRASPEKVQFTRLRKALCSALDAGRHWPARNTVAACGTWRELEALFDRDLPTLDGQILRIGRDPHRNGFHILRHDPTHPQTQVAVARLLEGVDY